ncbi:hypothetical protein Hanom_Chr04g00339461 [Helianthus anomalus]
MPHGIFLSLVLPPGNVILLPEHFLVAIQSHAFSSNVIVVSIFILSFQTFFFKSQTLNLDLLHLRFSHNPFSSSLITVKVSPATINFVILFVILFRETMETSGGWSHPSNADVWVPIRASATAVTARFLPLKGNFKDLLYFL